MHNERFPEKSKLQKLKLGMQKQGYSTPRPQKLKCQDLQQNFYTD